MFMIPGTGPTSLSVCEFRGTEKDQGNFPSLSAELQALGAGMGVKAKLIFKYLDQLIGHLKVMVSLEKDCPSKKKMNK